MANFALQGPVFTSCCNISLKSSILEFPFHSSAFPRASPKSSSCFVPRIVPTLIKEARKDCMVRTLSPSENVTPKTAIPAVQDPLQKGNAISNSEIADPSRTATRKKAGGSTTLMEGSGSNVEIKNRRKKTPRRQDNSLEIKEDNEDDNGDFEYEWPPLVCCFGPAQNEFVPIVRVSERQMDKDMYSTWKSLQWNPPEFARAPGGSPFSVAIALARLGGRAAFMGKVGDDPLGYWMVQTMNKENVQTRGVKFDPYAATAVSYMKLTCSDGKFGMECIKPCAQDCLHSSEINIDILKEARMFHFNSMALLEQPASTLSAIKMSREFGGVIFFDPNLPMPLWRSRDETRRIIQEAWNESDVIEVTIQELDFLLDYDYFYKKRTHKHQYYSQDFNDAKGRRRSYHTTREELSPLWHDNIKILFVTDGTIRIHYYTPTFEGEVMGTEDVLVAPYTCDRTGAGDAIVAGIIAQWTTGTIPSFPTESATQELKEQVYVKSLW
ncbi:fructokinase-like 1, chloroplastic isoform X2 [Cryptomeria japonica]|uniref:fructokinase-like 1, chloroplastic isoform X2 n=1 Tax=Cryptomeria japonica TaxID=3369 RepID=UPI0027DA2854|nr:fructokinase-like 1, chloroplastic isoform X2 [Cryptomeria japonica]